jgi:Skp family chaperone for outer membrane proteins
MRSFAVKNSVLALFCLTLAAGQTPAQTAAPAKIGILNAQAALFSTKDGQAASEELKKRFEPKIAELQKKETELRDIQDRISRGQNTMAPVALQELQKQFDQKKKAFDRDKQDLDDEGNAAESKITSELSEKLKKVIDKIGLDGGYTLIIDVSNPNTGLVYFQEGTDITQAVIEAYDKTVSTAKPAVSAVKPPPAKPATPPPAAAPKPPPPAAPAKP